MKKLISVLLVLISFYALSAQEADMFGDTSEPITNEDKLEENEGKETNAAPVKSEKSKGGNKFQKFVHRSPDKKALAGIKVGPEIYHYTYINDNNIFKDGTYGGFHMDAFLEYNFVKNFGLQVELNFGGGRLGFFRMPIIAQFNLPINDMFWLNFGAGLYLGYWAGFDIGLIGKVALEINTKVGVFVADFRYSPSLYYVKDDLFLGSIAILVGYAVPLPF